jgi:type IV secretory pathway TrbL component
MNAKKIWSVICFVIALGLLWSAYSRLRAQDAFAALFHVVVGMILWAQGRSKKEPIQPPVPTRGNGT